MAGADLPELFSRVSEELRTQDGSQLHRQLREADSGSARLAVLLQLHAAGDIRPRGPGHRYKAQPAAAEWLLRERHAETAAERLVLLNLAVQTAPTPGPDEVEPRDHGVTLTEALLRRQHVLHSCGRPTDRADNELYLRQVMDTLPETTRRKYDAELTSVLGSDGSHLGSEVLHTPQQLVKLPKIYGGLHYKLKRVSATVNVEYRPGRGRCLVANEDIPPGSVIITDSPYAWALRPNLWSTHCQTCCRRTMAPVPCTRCAAVVFCSAACRLAGWQRFHAAECAILEHLRAGGGGGGALTPMVIMVVRTVLTAGMKRLLPYLERADVHDISSVDPHAAYDSLEYAAVFDQVPNSAFRSILDTIRRGTIAIYLLRCLQLTELGVAQLSEPQQLQLAALLLRHLESCACNGFQLSELVSPSDSGAGGGPEDATEDDDDEPQALDLGGAVSATVSLLNHSCDPNVTRVNRGRHLITITTRTIGAGEELQDNYCALFHEAPYAKRQNILHERYHFKCACVACQFHWPMYDRLPAVQPRAHVRDILETGSTYENDGEHASAATAFAAAVQLVEREHDDRLQPCRLMVDCQAFLTRCLWLAHRL